MMSGLVWRGLVMSLPVCPGSPRSNLLALTTLELDPERIIVVTVFSLGLTVTELSRPNTDFILHIFFIFRNHLFSLWISKLG